MTTHVILVTDKSGSMYDKASDVRGGYNSYLDDLEKDTKMDYRISSMLFDTEYMALCVDAPLAEAPRLTETNYQAGGNTALIDAVGKSITDFEKRTPSLGETDRVLLVVLTDGYENSSYEYDNKAVQKMVKDREARGKWACVFLGAGIDAWAQAGNLGFASVASTRPTSKGYQTTYTSMSANTRLFARGATGQSVANSIQEDQDKIS